MKWTRKTKEFQYADYVSDDGKWHIRDMSFHEDKWWRENGRNGYWWGIIKINEDGTETIKQGNIKTVKEAKQIVEEGRA